MSASTPNDESPLVQQTDENVGGPVPDRGGTIGELPAWYKRALALTLLVDGGAAFYLALRDFQLQADPLGPVFAAMLLAISVTNLLALYSMLAKLASWQIQAVFAQALVVFLALYVVATATQIPSPRPWWGWCLLGVSVVIGIAALGWTLRLLHLGRLKEFHWSNWTKTATAIVALVPLGGLVSFWIQSDYLPKVTDPLIDVSTELKPIGRFTPSGDAAPIIRLSAKVTFHNRGAVKAYIAGALMRVMAYPYRPGPDPAVTPDLVQQELHLWTDAESVFRPSPMSPADAKLLYAEDLAGDPPTSLEPGETMTNQREVDIDSKEVRLARLTGYAVFFTDRRIRRFEMHPDPDTNHTGFSSIYYYIAPRSAIQEIIAGDAVLEVQLFTQDRPDAQDPHEHEYPRFDY